MPPDIRTDYNLLLQLKAAIQCASELSRQRLVDFAVECWLEKNIYFRVTFQESEALICINHKDEGCLAIKIVRVEEKEDLDALAYLDLSNVLFKVTSLLKDKLEEDSDNSEESAPDPLTEAERAECVNEVLGLINSADSGDQMLAKQLIAAFKDRFDVYEETIAKSIRHKQHSDFIFNFIRSHR